MLSGLELTISLVAVFIGSTIMGTVSFGLALVVAPVLILFLDPQSVVIIANFLIVILLVFVFIKVRSHLKLNEIKGLLMADTAYYYPEDRSISESVSLGAKLAKLACKGT